MQGKLSKHLAAAAIIVFGLQIEMAREMHGGEVRKIALPQL